MTDQQLLVQQRRREAVVAVPVLIFAAITLLHALWVG